MKIVDFQWCFWIRIHKFQQQITILGGVVKGRFDDSQDSLRKTSKSGAARDLETEIKNSFKQLLVVISMILCIDFYENAFFRSQFDTLIKAVSSYKSTRFYFFKNSVNVICEGNIFLRQQKSFEKVGLKLVLKIGNFFQHVALSFPNSNCVVKLAVV